MKVLNAFAGIGGNRKYWDQVKPNLEVTAVEINQEIADQYKIFYPQDTIIVADAFEYIVQNYDQFDFIWASPECPTHSITNHYLHEQGVRRLPDFRLYSLIVFLQTFASKKKILWVVENVKPYYKLLVPPAFVYGRHYYWSNRKLPLNEYKLNEFNILNCKKQSRKTDRVNEQQLFELYELGKEEFILTNKLRKKAIRNMVNPNEAKMIFKLLLSKRKLNLLEAMSSI